MNNNLIIFTGKIPDETTALQIAPSAIAGMIPGTPSWPSNVISQVSTVYNFLYFNQNNAKFYLHS